ILALGRRLPRWPECHIPAWASSLSWEEQKEEIRLYIREVVDRYKDEPHISYWQVENEPYLEIFAHEQCGDFDEAFFKEEIELVRSLDGMRPILVTDSGNLGTWSGAYSAADAFGTSVYVYFWNQNLGQFRTILPPVIYRIKENLMTLFHGRKPTFLIELSLEPWLIAPVTDVAVETQLERMNPEKFDEIIVYARQTRYDRQYLWGAEWWYWLKARGYPEMWEKGKELFRQ
ncbi:MAG: beta-galactosidase, partial [Patescibacteria group bacterium]|nr:beta-galactosidase [Patescibacteria group bacterium]